MTLPTLIATDVDGTLIGDDERISARTRAAITAAVASGTRFVLATGRPPRWVPPIVEQLGFAPPAVCANGAVVYDPSTDRILSARTLSTDALARLADVSVRALQAIFQRHTGLAPMAYLRRLRLDRAHADLLRARPGETTVALVAHRWGLGHLGRFAAAYRERYGVSPSETLRLL